MDEFWFPHGQLMDAYPLSRTNFSFRADASQTLTDFHGKLLIFARTPHGHSRTFMDNFWFSQEVLTNVHGLSRTNFDFFMDASQTLTDFYRQFLIFLRTLTDVHGQFLIFSRTLTDFHGRILISPGTPHGRSRTFTDNFSFPHGCLTDAHVLSRTNFKSCIIFEA